MWEVDKQFLCLVKAELLGVILNCGSMKKKWQGVTKNGRLLEACRRLSAAVGEV
jgi:hypothetical protein